MWWHSQKKIFDEASAKIETSTNLHGDSKVEAIEYLRAMRRRLMFGAMVHDMGEMEGEISQGIEVAKQPDEIRKLFDIQRENIEQKVFDKHLDELATKPDSKGNAIYKHPQWEGSEGCKGRKNTFIDAFELAEHKETFAGRLLKSLERMQSQQDYLRFQSLLADSDYPRLHQPPIRKSHTSRYTPEQIQEEADKNKRFSLNYVSSIFRDASIHDAQGQNSLEHIGEREGNFVQRTVHAALVVAMKAEYNHLMTNYRLLLKDQELGSERAQDAVLPLPGDMLPNYPFKKDSL